MINEKKTSEFAMKFYNSLTNTFKDKEKRIDIEPILPEELTENFLETMSGLLFAFNGLYCDMTGQEMGALEFTYLLNSLTFDYMMEHGDRDNGDGAIYEEDIEINDDESYDDVKKFTKKYIN